MSTVIQVENLSKQYRLGEVGTGTIGDDINRWWHRVRGKEDPFLKIGEENDRTRVGSSEYVWALRDINFEVKQGEILGIIGRNGAGKSTLLKILSRTTAPTTGFVNIKGKVASLLEVGTGFHQELSGRENIFLNGAIMGMRKAEIQRKLDEIIDFSGVERYIDTPVKRYSSGMYVRLAFAVAAHLEPDILIIDEVLAVGDAEFQKKCLGKMGEITEGQGRTVLFVSHNMASLQNLCPKSIMLKSGLLVDSGYTKQVVERYLSGINTSSQYVWENDGSKENEQVNINRVSVSKVGDPDSSVFYINDDLKVKIHATFKNKVPSAAFELNIYSIDGTLLTCSFTESINAEEKNYEASFIIPKNILNNQYYTLTVGVSQNYSHFINKLDNVLAFQLQNSVSNYGWQGDNYPGLIRPPIKGFIENEST